MQPVAALARAPRLRARQQYAQRLRQLSLHWRGSAPNPRQQGSAADFSRSRRHSRWCLQRRAALPHAQQRRRIGAQSLLWSSPLEQACLALALLSLPEASRTARLLLRGDALPTLAAPRRRVAALRRHAASLLVLAARRLRRMLLRSCARSRLFAPLQCALPLLSRYEARWTAEAQRRMLWTWRSWVPRHSEQAVPRDAAWWP